MSRTLVRLSFLITMCTSTPLPLPLIHASQIISTLTVSVIGAQLQLQRTVVSSAAIMATHRRHSRRHLTPCLSVPRAAYRKGVLYGSADKDMMSARRSIITSPRVEPRFLRSTNSGVLSHSEPVAAAAPIFPETFLVPSDTPSAGPSYPAVINMSQPSPVSHPRLHPAFIPVFVGSAMGAVLLAALTFFIVYWKRIRARGRTKRSIRGFRGFFNSNKKNDVVFIRVPPPALPLKSILIRNPSQSPAFDDPSSDRMSVTSSQMSMIINKLPKSYDSGLEDGVLDEGREHGGSSSIRVATRIGPSPSDFITNLFGLSNADSFSSESSSTSGKPTLPPSLSSPILRQSPSRSRTVNVITSAYELPPLTLANSPKPAFPPAVASPTLSHTSGPRGHGLVLTGDSSLTPSFAQWHHQRNMARGRDGNITYGPQS